MARKSTEKTAETDPLSFEQAIARLEALVDEVEGGTVDLEKVLDRYAEGTALIKRCQTVLDAAEQRIAELTLDAKGVLRPKSPPAAEMAAEDDGLRS